MTRERLLVLQLARMGDILQTIPLIRRLRLLHPQARLEVLSDRMGPEVLAGCREVDEVLPLDLEGLYGTLSGDFRRAYAALAARVEEWRRRRFDRIYNLNFSPLTVRLSYLLGASEVSGYRPVPGGRGWRRDPWLAYIYGLVHARRVNRINLGDVFRWLEPGKGIAGVGLDQPRRARPLPGVGPWTIALQLGSQHAQRRWPLEYYGRLAERLICDYEARIVLLGTAAERRLGRQLVRELPTSHRDRVENLQGRTDLAQLREQVRQSSLLITGDTGTMHLAATEGTPVLALFLGPAQGFETGPYGLGHHVLQAEPDCHPCAEAVACPHDHLCARMLEPDTVAAVVEAHLPGGGRDLGGAVHRPGVQLYVSEADALGVILAPLTPRPWRLADVMGMAYREAGKLLVGLEPGELRTQGGYERPQGKSGQRLRQRVEEVLQGLERGEFSPGGEVEEGLRPLTAWGRELAQAEEVVRDRGRRVRVGLRQVLTRWLEGDAAVNDDNGKPDRPMVWASGTSQSGSGTEVQLGWGS